MPPPPARGGPVDADDIAGKLKIEEEEEEEEEEEALEAIGLFKEELLVVVVLVFKEIEEEEEEEEEGLAVIRRPQIEVEQVGTEEEMVTFAAAVATKPGAAAGA